MRNYDMKNVKVELHNILFTTTQHYYYEANRLLLLENMPNTEFCEYIMVEGYHCSCYGFDETKWDATVFTAEELDKLMEKDHYDDLRKELREFWNRYRNGD